jgi:hypothetical protein
VRCRMGFFLCEVDCHFHRLTVLIESNFDKNPTKLGGGRG